MHKRRIHFSDCCVSDTLARSLRVGHIAPELFLEKERSQISGQPFAHNAASLAAHRRDSANPQTRHSFCNPKRRHSIKLRATECSHIKQESSAISKSRAAFDGDEPD